MRFALFAPFAVVVNYTAPCVDRILFPYRTTAADAFADDIALREGMRSLTLLAFGSVFTCESVSAIASGLE